ncbi:FAD-dependent oxidoreductase [Sinomonas gamaensis]|uniref:FAD-dependent oxidoreductase n=1 Tax=Sinomonas gamaensis TaxID=2565624 RepID=UPI00110971FB|nr:FAD-dependent oxidoreductase [Sinomonas gamaensis]
MGAKKIVIIGGGLGAIAASLSAARLGVPSIIVSECSWLGGQVSSQAIPPDEHPWIEMTGCTETYRQFRNGVRAFYRDHYPLNAQSRSAPRLNPGLGNIGPLSHEPFVAGLVIEQMLAPWRSRGLIEVLRGWRIVEAETTGDHTRSVRVRSDDGEEKVLEAEYFLDTTDLGDLVAAAGVEHVIGAESTAETGEPHALPGESDPTDQQAITWAAALRLSPHTENIIDKPGAYDRWRSYQPDFWPGPLLGWDVSDYVTHQPRHRPLFLASSQDGEIHYDLWHARRALAASQMEDGWESDTTIAAWPMMDYWQIPLLGSEEGAGTALAEAREFTLSFIYWMQTEAPRHDGGTGYPELRPHGEVTGTPDGLAMLPYIREGRRIKAEFTVLEQHIGVAARAGLDGAEPFKDSVGVGAYRMDLHPSSSGRNTLDLDTWPFQVPLGALIPQRAENVLAAGKAMGTTHLTNGAYRVHPIEWSVGEAAGALAAFCLSTASAPRQVRSDPRRLEDLRRSLAALGVETEWPSLGALTPERRFGYLPPPR